MHEQLAPQMNARCERSATNVRSQCVRTGAKSIVRMCNIIEQRELLEKPPLQKLRSPRPLLGPLELRARGEALGIRLRRAVIRVHQLASAMTRLLVILRIDEKRADADG